jgi:hypothetical protein
MKIQHLFLLLFFAGYTLAASTVDYNVSGTVIKKGGGPLAGVNVLLKGKNVSVVTGASGAFEIIPTNAIRMKAPQAQTLSFTLNRNALKFSSVEGSLNGNVSILSGNGRIIASIGFSKLNPMTDQITLPHFASGLNIVRVTINNTVHTCQVVSLESELHLSNVSRTDADFSLARTTAAAMVDTLIATKAQFEQSKTPISSYTLSNVAIVMDSTVGGIAWGRKENPTAGCTVGTLPDATSFQANIKLPDPFTKLDGKRITNKSEWACRREEILQSMFKYIIGEKPIPPAGSVSGTVSTTKISVTVSEGGKTCSFSATVSMNGATAPAPAIIIYDGGMGSSLPIPTGVAKITFSAVEGSGGSGAKTGPFYTFYGSDHPAGYMVAQAWQISRILDLLEQNPGTIDPFRIGVTGCSRNGKGAFWGGVLDNRIALTIPCESGIGGTVALRLVEQLDTGGEWPYHAISYVRWLSEVALGKFTTANSASGDNTAKLPIDIHEAMALVAPRGIYIVDNASGTYAGLDRSSAYVTGSVGKKIFEALGLSDNFTYECASGDHCTWRSQYNTSLAATIDKFLKGNASAKTGTFNSDLGSKPDPKSYYVWDAAVLPGEL